MKISLLNDFLSGNVTGLMTRIISNEDKANGKKLIENATKVEEVELSIVGIEQSGTGKGKIVVHFAFQYGDDPYWCVANLTETIFDGLIETYLKKKEEWNSNDGN
jgi:hypothetical protein